MRRILAQRDMFVFGSTYDCTPWALHSRICFPSHLCRASSCRFKCSTDSFLVKGSPYHANPAIINESQAPTWGLPQVRVAFGPRSFLEKPQMSIVRNPYQEQSNIISSLARTILELTQGQDPYLSTRLFSSEDFTSLWAEKFRRVETPYAVHNLELRPLDISACGGLVIQCSHQKPRVRFGDLNKL